MFGLTLWAGQKVEVTLTYFVGLTKGKGEVEDDDAPRP